MDLIEKFSRRIFLIKRDITRILASLTFLITQRILDWPLVKIINLKEQNYCDFTYLARVGNFNYEEWKIAKKTVIPYGDASWALAKIMTNLSIPIIFIIFVIQFLFVYVIIRELESKLNKRFIFIVLLCMPPISLALQRCNLDLLIFLLVILAYKKRKYKLLAASLLAVCTLLKFYTIFSLLALINKKNSRFTNSMVLSLFMLLLVYALIQSRGTKQIFVGSMQFGMATMGYYFALLLERLGLTQFWYSITGWTAIGAFSLVISIFLFNKRSLRRIIEGNLFSLETIGKNFDNEKAIFPLAILSCFILTLNFDYRLIFILPLLSKADLSNPKKNDGKLWNTLILASMLFTGAIWVPLQFIGDISLLLLVTILILARIDNFRSLTRLKPKSFNYMRLDQGQHEC